MTVHRRPPPEAKREDHKLAATWSVTRKRKGDPDETAWLRLSLRSTDEAHIAFGIDLSECVYVCEFDVKRQGMWIGLVDKAYAKRTKGATTKFAPWKNQTRVNFHSTVGLFVGMGTELHDVKVEVWRNWGSEDVICSWLFAPLQHTELLTRFKGFGLVR